MSVRMYSNSLPLFACSTPDALGTSGEERAQGIGFWGGPVHPGASDALT